MRAQERAQAAAARLGRGTDRAEHSEERTARPVRTVRRTVDLSAQHHRDLNRLCADAAVERGWARVNSQDMLATLVAELLRDAVLQRRVISLLPAPKRRGGG